MGKIPSHLSAEGKEIWRKLVREYDIQDAGGLQILRAGLEAFDRAQKCRVSIDRIGLVVKDRFGAVRPHPLIACERDARSSFLLALKQLNLDVQSLKDIGRPPGT
jgi:P27 family predicted phage terminase small subunit